ncbi:DUF6415 family natural product biosynthesis protein [Streptomyces sp. AC495_CC817]|uniref:DUF6415 family natural product biosynthesis protein n=1 Tax=Streptomyces sp. AC495_CC817 TaxID=2823900 RepID=UPI0020B6F643|nr:DUF6415 family natural product biosynthesis protein [Streptomyces sp. AC495_CC817]
MAATPTVRSSASVERDRIPLDIETMRATARSLLAEDAEPPNTDELETLTLKLRGHIMVAVPEVEAAAGPLPEGDVPRACALACVGEARMRLGLEPGPALPAGIAHAQRLARSVNALCDHHENLADHAPGSEKAAVEAIDQPLRPWGLTRMEPYPKPHAVAAAVGLDPVSQRAVFHDSQGRPVEMGKHGTGSGTETRTQTSQGDGSGPSNTDEGHDQDADRD